MLKKEQNLFLTKKLRAIVITRYSRTSRDSFSGKFRVPSYFDPIVKTITLDFIMTRGLILVDKMTFPSVTFSLSVTSIHELSLNFDLPDHHLILYSLLC